MTANFSRRSGETLKRNTRNKLALGRETIRSLAGRQIGAALGGCDTTSFTTEGAAMPSLTSWCNCSVGNTLCTSC